MKRFISVRNKSIYSKYYLKVIFIIVLIIIINVLIASFLNSNFSNLLYKNAYGLNNNFYNYNLLYKNAFGFNILDTKVMGQYGSSSDLFLGNPIIYIYNTFQTDKYKSEFTNKYNINPVITQASLILQDYLKRYEIYTIVESDSVVRVSQDNDIPYDKSYRGSRILLENAYLNNPSLEYFIDLQMASNTRESVLIDDLSYARILFVIGTEFDSFKENEKLALSLNNILENNYQGISMGIDYRGGEGYHGIYNEDFHDGVIMIEVGSKDNTIDEVNRTLKVLAEVWVQYLKEKA